MSSTIALILAALCISLMSHFPNAQPRQLRYESFADSDVDGDREKSCGSVAPVEPWASSLMATFGTPSTVDCPTSTTSTTTTTTTSTTTTTNTSTTTTFTSTSCNSSTTTNITTSMTTTTSNTTETTITSSTTTNGTTSSTNTTTFSSTATSTNTTTTTTVSRTTTNWTTTTTNSTTTTITSTTTTSNTTTSTNTTTTTTGSTTTTNSTTTTTSTNTSTTETTTTTNTTTTGTTTSTNTTTTPHTITSTNTSTTTLTTSTNSSSTSTTTTHTTTNTTTTITLTTTNTTTTLSSTTTNTTTTTTTTTHTTTTTNATTTTSTNTTTTTTTTTSSTRTTNTTSSTNTTSTTDPNATTSTSSTSTPTTTTSTSTTTSSTTTTLTTTFTTTNITTSTTSTTSTTTVEKTCATPCGLVSWSSTCDRVGAGTSRNDCLGSQYSLVKACLPETFELTCPAVAGLVPGTHPIYAVPSTIKCRPCFVSEVVDRDPVAGKYSLLFTFGDLVTTDGAYIPDVTHYEVALVNKNGFKLRTVAMVDADQNQASCCEHAKYSIRLRFNASDMKEYYPSGYYRWSVESGHPMMLAITPRADAIYLPYLAFSAPIVDNTTGQVQIQRGSFEMMMSPDDANRLVENPKAKIALGRALALSAGLNPVDVFITAMWISGIKAIRRLGKRSYYVVQSGRRLLCCPPGQYYCGGPPCPVEVRVDYEIMLPVGSPVIDTSSSYFMDMLQESILKQTAAIGAPVTLTEPMKPLEPAVVTEVGSFVKSNETTTVPPIVKTSSRAAFALVPSLKAIAVIVSTSLLTTWL